MSSTKRTKTASPHTSTTSNSSPPSYSAEKIADNDDLLNQILLCLPIKSLIKFKSVSKHWLSLITNSNFSRRRNPNFPTSASGLFFMKHSRSRQARPEFDFIDLNRNFNPARAPFRSLNFVDDKHGIMILQSCNGLLLCCTSHVIGPRRNHYVYNPATKHYAKLPPLLFPRGTFRAVYGVTLAFDPSKSPHYKVISVRNSDAEEGQFRIEIYSTETGHWRFSSNIGPFPEDFTEEIFDDGVFWNGTVHWFCPLRTSLYFKVDEGRLCEMPMLPVLDNANSNNTMLGYLGESRDHLPFVDYIRKLGEIRLNVYEMERDYSGWFVKYRVDLSQVSRAFPEIIPSSLFHQLALQYHLLSILCVVRGEHDEGSFLVFGIPSKMLRYNFKCRTIYNLCDIEPTGTETSAEMSLVLYVYQ